MQKIPDKEWYPDVAVMASLTHDGMEFAAESIGMGIAQGLIRMQFSEGLTEGLTNGKGTMNPDSDCGEPIVSVPKKQNVELLHHKRLQLLDPFIKPWQRKTAYQHLTYSSLLSIVMASVRSGPATTPISMAVDGLQSGKIPFSCVRIRGFFDVGQEEALKKIIPILLRMPPIRIDKAQMDVIYHIFRGIYDARVSGGEVTPYVAALKEGYVLRTVEHLITFRILGKDRILMVVSDLGSSQRKYYLFCMLGEGSKRKLTLFELDLCHEECREVANMVAEWPMIEFMSRQIARLNGTKTQFVHQLSKFGQVRTEVVNYMIEFKKPPPAVTYLAEPIVEEARIIYGPHWSTNDVLQAAFARSISGISKQHQRWCQPIYMAWWLESRWYVLHCLSEMVCMETQKKETQMNKIKKKLVSHGQQSFRLECIEAAKRAKSELDDVKHILLEVVDVERKLRPGGYKKDGGEGDSSDGSDAFYYEELSSDSEDDTDELLNGKSDLLGGKKKKQRKCSNPSDADDSKQTSEYKSAVCENNARALRDEDLHLQITAFSHSMRAKIAFHTYSIMENHFTLLEGGAAQAPYFLCYHPELYYPCSMCMTASMGQTFEKSPYVLQLIQRLKCADDMVAVVGKMVLQILAIQAKNALKRVSGIYRVVQHGKKISGDQGRQFIQSHREERENLIKLLRGMYSELLETEEKGATATNKFCMERCHSYIPEYVNTFAKEFDLFTYDIAAIAEAEVELFDNLQKLEEKVIDGDDEWICPKRNVFETALRRFHKTYVYTEFMRNVKKDVVKARAENTNVTSIPRPNIQAAEQMVLEMRRVRMMTTRSIEAEGSRLNRYKKTHQGKAFGTPWRMLAAQLPTEPFPWLRPLKEEDVKKDDNKRKSVESRVDRMLNLFDSDTNKPIALAGSEGYTASSSVTSTSMGSSMGAKKSEIDLEGGKVLRQNFLKNENSIRLGESLAKSFEEYLGNVGFIPPSMIVDNIEADDFIDENSGEIIKGAAAVQRVANIISRRVSSGQKNLKHAWADSAEEVGKCYALKAGDEMTKTEVEGFMRWGFDTNTWWECGLAETLVWQKGEWILDPDWRGEEFSRMETGKAQAFIMKYLKEWICPLCISMQDRLCTLLLSSTNLNTIVVLELEPCEWTVQVDGGPQVSPARPSRRKLREYDAEDPFADLDDEFESEIEASPVAKKQQEVSGRSHSEQDMGLRNNFGTNSFQNVGKPVASKHPTTFKLPVDVAAYCWPQIHSRKPNESMFYPIFLTPSNIMDWRFSLAAAGFEFNGSGFRIVAGNMNKEPETSNPLYMFLKMAVLSDRIENNSVPLSVWKEILVNLIEYRGLKETFDIMMEVPAKSACEKNMQEEAEKKKSAKQAKADEKKNASNAALIKNLLKRDAGFVKNLIAVPYSAENDYSKKDVLPTGDKNDVTGNTSKTKMQKNKQNATSSVDTDKKAASDPVLQKNMSAMGDADLVSVEQPIASDKKTLLPPASGTKTKDGSADGGKFGLDENDGIADGSSFASKSVATGAKIEGSANSMNAGAGDKQECGAVGDESTCDEDEEPLLLGKKHSLYDEARKSFRMNDVLGVNFSSAMPLHRICVLLYFMSHSEASKALTSWGLAIDWDKLTLTYWVDLSFVRDQMFSKALAAAKRTTSKRGRSGLSTEEQAKRQKTAENRALLLAKRREVSNSIKQYLAPAAQAALGLPMPKIREEKVVVRRQRNVLQKEGAGTYNGNPGAVLQEQNALVKKWGAGAVEKNRADYKFQVLNWHTPDCNLLDFATRDVGKTYPVTCIYCNDETQLGYTTRSWVVMGKGPTCNIFGCNNKKIATRRLGPSSHFFLNDNECFCGTWSDTGNLTPAGNSQDSWWNCASAFALLKLNESKCFQNPKKCECQYPELKNMKTLKINWKVRTNV